VPKKKKKKEKKKKKKKKRSPRASGFNERERGATRWYQLDDLGWTCWSRIFGEKEREGPTSHNTGKKKRGITGGEFLMKVRRPCTENSEGRSTTKFVKEKWGEPGSKSEKYGLLGTKKTKHSSPEPRRADGRIRD